MTFRPVRAGDWVSVNLEFDYPMQGGYDLERMSFLAEITDRATGALLYVTKVTHPVDVELVGLLELVDTKVIVEPV